MREAGLQVTLKRREMNNLHSLVHHGQRGRLWPVFPSLICVFIAQQRSLVPMNPTEEVINSGCVLTIMGLASSQTRSVHTEVR